MKGEGSADDERPALTAEQLRHARANAGLSQAQAAAQIGVSTNTVGRWERGHNTPRGLIRARMLEVYGLEWKAGITTAPPAAMLERVAGLEDRMRDLEETVRRLADAAPEPDLGSRSSPR